MGGVKTAREIFAGAVGIAAAAREMRRGQAATWTAATLARALGVSSARAGWMLGELERDGMLRRDPSSPVPAWRVID